MQPLPLIHVNHALMDTLTGAIHRLIHRSGSTVRSTSTDRLIRSTDPIHCFADPTDPRSDPLIHQSTGTDPPVDQLIGARGRAVQGCVPVPAPGHHTTSLPPPPPGGDPRLSLAAGVLCSACLALFDSCMFQLFRLCSVRVRSIVRAALRWAPAADEQKEEWCAADPRGTFRLNRLARRVRGQRFHFRPD